MSRTSRRKFITGGIAAAAGIGGIGLAAAHGGRYGLIPPDCKGPFGAGETLTYAAQRLLAGHANAREFDRSQISEKPFANEVAPLGDKFKQLEHDGFSDWRLAVDGMAERPRSFTLAELKSYPSSSQITEIACEEGWSYIAEWKGVALAHVLREAGIKPEVRWVVYRSFQTDWWESIDMTDAMHSQTLVAYSMNGADMPVPFGGPLRLRLPRQLGYKSLKYLTQITLTNDIKKFGKGLGSASPEGGYAWYAGI
jgi:DMSO/TMAO reductase YedYZ molybdopterin-dependent catalytic subunit